MICWKKCPEDINDGRKYSFENEGDPTIAMKWGNSCSTIIGNTPFPPGEVTSCIIKVQSANNNMKKKGAGLSFYVGVAPADIDQGECYNFETCGWYLNCCRGTLCSGPPHSYAEKAYCPMKGDEPCIDPRGVFGIVADTGKGEVSFVVGEINLGAAYVGVPLDKPLVPCAILVNGATRPSCTPRAVWAAR